jgi:hypothetical protein
MSLRGAFCATKQSLNPAKRAIAVAENTASQKWLTTRLLQFAFTPQWTEWIENRPAAGSAVHYDLLASNFWS